MRSQHTCLLYEDLSEQKQYVLPFLREGLSQGEHCLLVCSEDSVEDWPFELQASGIDVAKHRESGALVISGPTKPQGRLDSISLARELWEYIEQSLANFPAVRIAADAVWTMLEPVFTPDSLCHWEATADLLFQDLPVRTLCMYDLNRHSPGDIRASLRTHSSIVLNGVRHSNHFYEAAEILAHEPDLNASDTDAELIAEMLGAFRLAREVK